MTSSKPKLTLKERIKSPSTRLGKILQTWVTFSLLFIDGLASCLEYLSVLPLEWALPPWVKIAILMASIISKTIGHMTVAKKDE